jgi:hypothetical protein
MTEKMMTTKEKVILESRDRITKEIASIDEILDANVILEFIRNRKRAEQMIISGEWKTKEGMETLEKLEKEEKRLITLAGKQLDSSEMISRKVKLQSELSDLNNELYHIISI